MILFSFLVFLMSAFPAFALMAPGPLPWHCQVYSICDRNQICINSMYGISFYVNDGEKKGFISILGLGGENTIGVLKYSTEDAVRFVEKYDINREKNRPLIFIERKIDGLDARNFDIHIISVNKHSNLNLSSKAMSAVCNGAFKNNLIIIVGLKTYVLRRIFKGDLLCSVLLIADL